MARGQGGRSASAGGPIRRVPGVGPQPARRAHRPRSQASAWWAARIGWCGLPAGAGRGLEVPYRDLWVWRDAVLVVDGGFGGSRARTAFTDGHHEFAGEVAAGVAVACEGLVEAAGGLGRHRRGRSWRRLGRQRAPGRWWAAWRRGGCHAGGAGSGARRTGSWRVGDRIAPGTRQGRRQAGEVGEELFGRGGCLLMPPAPGRAGPGVGLLLLGGRLRRRGRRRPRSARRPVGRSGGAGGCRRAGPARRRRRGGAGRR